MPPSAIACLHQRPLPLDGRGFVGVDHTQRSTNPHAHALRLSCMRIQRSDDLLHLDLSNSISYQFFHHLNLKFSFGRGTTSGGVRGGWNVVHEATTIHQIDNAHNHGIYREETYDNPSNTIQRSYAVADDEE